MKIQVFINNGNFSVLCLPSLILYFFSFRTSRIFFFFWSSIDLKISFLCLYPSVWLYDKILPDFLYLLFQLIYSPFNYVQSTYQPIHYYFILIRLFCFLDYIFAFQQCLFLSHLVQLLCCSRTFRETNSLRRTMQIVECSLLHQQVQGSLLLAKDPNQFLWKPYIPYVYVPKPISPNSLKLVWTKEKERYNQS